ncbi:bile acid:sodium symporter family protein [Campylobacter sp. MIT 97-5078]|uniref:bile acid:sodium symporter family protein n=1 Tax=Campylobacter sp. MIT 97-5078 TaxID=1548153 RepID=UPI0005146797|nr:bile acid:sodium symporter family protein [Campylobacter sp. MIT 97-5078]KGI56616.1 sodium transporter [Campylobacter sp. MIT 97-5078]TQR26806.1 bile acid:sodium symporter family protein [Campylobacter sp. MIT 97-5078]
MNFLKVVSNFFSKYMAIFILLVAALALFYPSSVSFIKASYINYLLMIVMFGMGLAMRASDFAFILKRPKDLSIGIIAQFTLMPLIAFVLCFLFNLPLELAIGVILVGACPGGTSSNVITYLAKGDLALSVSITSFSTFLAPLLTPLLTLFFVGEKVGVDVFAMFFSIVQIVIFPIFLGLLISHFFPRFTARIEEILPLISVLAIMAIVACVVSINSAKLMQIGLLIIIVVMLHNVLGYILGYLLAKILKMPLAKRKTICIEVGMQNSALATSLAAIHFASMPLATVAGAIFSVWHNISGGILANLLRLKEK